jgi:hypothetical protein
VLVAACAAPAARAGTPPGTVSGPADGVIETRMPTFSVQWDQVYLDSLPHAGECTDVNGSCVPALGAVIWMVISPHPDMRDGVPACIFDWPVPVAGGRPDCVKWNPPLTAGRTLYWRQRWWIDTNTMESGAFHDSGVGPTHSFTPDPSLAPPVPYAASPPKGAVLDGHRRVRFLAHLRSVLPTTTKVRFYAQHGRDARHSDVGIGGWCVRPATGDLWRCTTTRSGTRGECLRPGPWSWHTLPVREIGADGGIDTMEMPPTRFHVSRPRQPCR